MNRKRLFSGVLAMLLVVALLPATAQAAYTGNASNGCLIAYTEVLDKLCERYGLYPFHVRDDYRSGILDVDYLEIIFHASLEDFDGNGVPELLVCYTEGEYAKTQRSYAELWGYDGNKAYQIVKHVFHIGYGPSYELVSGLTVVDGKTYLFNEYDWYEADFYTLKDGKWIKAKTMGYDFEGPEEPISKFRVDGKAVSKAVFEQTQRKWLGNGEHFDCGVNDTSSPHVEYSRALVSLEVLDKQLYKRYATPSTAKFIIDGKTVELSGYAIAGSNYYRMRDIAMLLKGTSKEAEITWFSGWGSVDGMINIDEGSYTPTGVELTKVSTSAQYAPANFVYIGHSTEPDIGVPYHYSGYTAYSFNGNNFFAIRDLGRIFDFYVDWDSKAGAVIIDTTRGSGAW